MGFGQFPNQRSTEKALFSTICFFDYKMVCYFLTAGATISRERIPIDHWPVNRVDRVWSQNWAWSSDRYDKLEYYCLITQHCRLICKFTGDLLHNLTELHTAEQHTTELHTTQRLGGVLARLCAICPDSNTSWPNVGPKSVLSSRRWTNVSPTYIALRLVRLWRGLPIRVTHRTEPAYHRVVVLFAARWCVARWCVIWLGCEKGHPWSCKSCHKIMWRQEVRHINVSTPLKPRNIAW